MERICHFTILISRLSWAELHFHRVTREGVSWHTQKFPSLTDVLHIAHFCKALSRPCPLLKFGNSLAEPAVGPELFSRIMEIQPTCRVFCRLQHWLKTNFQKINKEEQEEHHALQTWFPCLSSLSLVIKSSITIELIFIVSNWLK